MIHTITKYFTFKITILLFLGSITYGKTEHAKLILQTINRCKYITYRNNM